jgi:DNA-binding CsgD family transcriptional regulator
MSLPELSALGVDAVAAEVLEVVLAEPDGVVLDDVAAALPVIDRGAVAVALEQLRQLGLVHRGAAAPPPSPRSDQRPAPEGRWAAIDPRVSVPALVTKRADALSAARASTAVLAELFDETRRLADPSATTRTLVGAAAVGDWYSRLELTATRSFLAFDRPPYVVAGNEATERTALARGVRWRAVYTIDSFGADGRWQGVRRLGGHGEEARLTDSLPVKLAVADERIALVSLGHDPVAPEALVTESPALVAALVELFEQRWRSAVPVPVERAPGDGAPGPASSDWALIAARVADEGLAASGGAATGGSRRPPSADERDLVALVAAGATDEVVAQRLGVSVRTVRRRLHELLAELGATNRFHAGVEASRRGWI